MGPFNSADRTSTSWIILALLSCASTDASEGTTSPVFESLNPLNGEWVQPCSSRFQRTETIEGNKVRLTENSFLDEFCAQEQTLLVTSGQISLGEPVQSPPGAAKIDFTFETVEVTLMTPETIRYSNEHSVCGFSDWRIAHAKNVTGLRCDLFGTGYPVAIPTAGEKLFGIYQVQASSPDGERSLFFGKLTPAENSKTEATRPTQLDPRFYRKIR